jgi:hypothetical protein
VPNKSKSILGKANGSLHIHSISLKNQSIPFIPDGPVASHKNLFETGKIVSSFAIKKKFCNGKLSIQF